MMDRDAHTRFIQNLSQQDGIEYWMSEHLRLSGMYWGITALDVMDRLDALDKAEVIRFTVDCQRDNGGFGGHPDHDAHLLYTLSAVQILVTYNALDRVDVERVVACMLSLWD
jgi:geranylgeranyl transferase type-2 subunit beta